jgi:CheY-like chemotaxis protein
MSRILGAAQIDVRVAGNATQALEILQSFQPDLLIIDLALPDLNGFEFLERARRNPKVTHIPAIAVTAFAREFEPERAKAAQIIDDFVTKPIDVRTFPARIQHYARLTVLRARMHPCDICGRTSDALFDVLSSGEVSTLFSDRLSESAVRGTIRSGRLNAAASGRSWLLRYVEVAARWGNEMLPPYRYWEGKAAQIPCPHCARTGDPLKQVIAITDDSVVSQGADFVRHLRNAAVRHEIASRKSAGIWLILRSAASDQVSRSLR